MDHDELVERWERRTVRLSVAMAVTMAVTVSTVEYAISGHWLSVLSGGAGLAALLLVLLVWWKARWLAEKLRETSWTVGWYCRRATILLLGVKIRVRVSQNLPASDSWQWQLTTRIRPGRRKILDPLADHFLRGQRRADLVLSVEALGPVRLRITPMRPGTEVANDIPSTVTTTAVYASYSYNLGSDHDGIVAMCHEGGLLVEALTLAAERPEYPWTLIFRERRPNFE